MRKSDSLLSHNHNAFKNACGISIQAQGIKQTARNDSSIGTSEIMTPQESRASYSQDDCSTLLCLWCGAECWVRCLRWRACWLKSSRRKNQGVAAAAVMLLTAAAKCWSVLPVRSAG